MTPRSKIFFYKLGRIASEASSAFLFLIDIWIKYFKPLN